MLTSHGGEKVKELKTIFEVGKLTNSHVILIVVRPFVLVVWPCIHNASSLPCYEFRVSAGVHTKHNNSHFNYNKIIAVTHSAEQ